MVEIDVVSSLLVFMVWFGSLEHTGVHTVGQADAGGGGGRVLYLGGGVLWKKLMSGYDCLGKVEFSS